MTSRHTIIHPQPRFPDGFSQRSGHPSPLVRHFLCKFSTSHRTSNTEHRTPNTECQPRPPPVADRPICTSLTLVHVRKSSQSLLSSTNHSCGCVISSHLISSANPSTAWINLVIIPIDIISSTPRLQFPANAVPDGAENYEGASPATQPEDVPKPVTKKTTKKAGTQMRGDQTEATHFRHS